MNSKNKLDTLQVICILFYFLIIIYYFVIEFGDKSCRQGVCKINNGIILASEFVLNCFKNQKLQLI